MKIGFQGTRGAYSEEAILKFFANSTDVTVQGFPISDLAVEALVTHKDIDCVVLPVENSIAGTVSMNMDLLLKYPIYATDEIYLPINHNLLALKGTSLTQIKRIISHPIAIAQCQNFIKKYNIQAIPEYDTAGSCKLLVESQRRDTAVIASKLCSEVYDLEVISNEIQQVKKNITRFLVFQNENDFAFERDSIEKKDKISIAFSTLHKPGALHDCLEVFKIHSLNMSRLESRPIPENPFIYTFFVDFFGELNDPTVTEAIDELKKHCEFFKILGYYKSSGL